MASRQHLPVDCDDLACLRILIALLLYLLHYACSLVAVCRAALVITARARTQALVLPFSSSLLWDECVIWYPVKSRTDISRMFDQLRALARDKPALLQRQHACERLRDRASVWDFPQATHSASDDRRCLSGFNNRSPPMRAIQSHIQRCLQAPRDQSYCVDCTIRLS